MAKTFSYDPSLITDGKVNQMRFELGDTSVEGGEETCALCDEEYQAIINETAQKGKSFGYAKCKCLDAIVSKLAFEVDFSADSLSVSLSQRYERWKEMLSGEKKKRQYISANLTALGENSLDGGHYFRLGMNDNDRISAPVFPFRRG